MMMDIYHELPDGFKIDNTCTPKKSGFVYITNGVSMLKKGHVRALLKVDPMPPEFPKYTAPPVIKAPVIQQADIERPLNDLARKQMQQKLLADVRVDLIVCELEGWNKREYINELFNLLAQYVKAEGIQCKLI